MSIESVAIAINHSRAKGTAKVVMIGIANHDGDGGAWPAVATLARYANTTARNVQKAIAQLEELGEVRRYMQAGGFGSIPDHRRPNRYEVLLHCPAWCDRTPQHRDSRKPLVAFRDDLSTGVSNSTPGVDSDRGGLSNSTPEPSFNHLNPLNEESLDPNAREKCVGGHELIHDGERSFCAIACAADFEARQRELEAVSS